MNISDRDQAVAIVGMALRVPGATTLEGFWSNLVQGRDSLTRPGRGELERMGLHPREIANPSFVAAKPLLDHIEYFDTKFFGIPKSQAELMDPTHRIFLECAWEALEVAGIIPGDGDQATGVFAGVEGHYLEQNLKSAADADPAVRVPKRLGNLTDYFSLRVSHSLNLVGPSLTALATCSTSLMAVHLAIQNLRLGECSVAIAGGARVDLPVIPGYRTGVKGMFSSSGYIRPFDSAADGTIFGDGAGVVVLKRLEDAIKDGNPAFGVILGSGFCNDGKPEDKISFTAPTPSGQKRAIKHAFKEAVIGADTIGFVECHGTGTLLGDPIEVMSLTDVFREHTSGTGFCALGSVKGNIGHLGPASGVVSLIKTCMILTKGVIPPVAHFLEPNAEIDFESSPFFVNSSAMAWDQNQPVRRACVSAFGFGGPNAHLILEQFPQEAPSEGAADPRSRLLIVSAKSRPALTRRVSDLACFLEENPQTSVDNVAHTLQHGRMTMPYRAYAVVDNSDERGVVKQLRTLNTDADPCGGERPVVFLFPGQGSQVLGMGRGLYDNEPVFREIVDHCAEVLVDELDFDIREKIYPLRDMPAEETRAALTQTAIAQPALFVIEYALAKLFRDWGLKSDAMLGHSLGELVAACLAGVFSLDDGLHIVAIRSRLMQRCKPGAMVAVSLPLQELMDMLPEELDFAAANSPTRNVVAGPLDAMERFVSDLKKRSISSQSLKTSHAFHSRMLDETLEEFRSALGHFSFNAPEECVISNITGLPLTENQACSPGYWVDQRRKPVLFYEGLSQFLTADNPIFIEVGPNRALAGFVNQVDSSRDAITALYRPREDVSQNAHRIAMDTLGKAWTLGARVDWPDRTSVAGSRKIPLPTYPFQQRYHWQDTSKPPEESTHRYALNLYENGWSRAGADELTRSDHSGRWLVFADDLGIADDVVLKLRQSDHSVTVLETGDHFNQISDQLFEIAPGSRKDLRQLFSGLNLLDNQERLRVLHFWSLTEGDEGESDFALYRESLSKAFHTLIALLQAAHSKGCADRMDVMIFVNGLSQFDDEKDPLCPEKGLLLGPCLVCPQEISGLTMRCIDIPGASTSTLGTALVDAIYDELFLQTDKPVTALREEGRYSEELFELPEISRGLPRLRHSGSVLITGGAGGLGLQIAGYLHETLNARLVLTSRWQVPHRSEWAACALEDSKRGRALKALSRLVDSGAELIVIQVDVTDMEDMVRVKVEAEAAFGKIHGVIHAAGTLDDGPSLQKTWESAEYVIASKVMGAYVLDNIFRDEPLDLFVYFSSQASVRPSKGQVDYSAANAVLDRLARRRRQNYAGLSCAIGWGAWRDVGMAWEYRGSSIETSSLFRSKTGVVLEPETRNVSHPVLKNYRFYVDGDALFSGSIRQGEHWVTTEHPIRQNWVLSGTTVQDLFRTAFKVLQPGVHAVEIKNLTILNQFVVEETTDYEILFVAKGDGYEVELRTKVNPATEWTINAMARLRQIDDGPTMDPAVLKLLLSMKDKVLEPCAPMPLGQRWHCDWASSTIDDGFFTRVRLQEQFVDEVYEFDLHPAIFDRSIHFITEHFVGPLIPFSAKSIRIYADLPAETLVFGKPSDPESKSTFDIWIASPGGEVLVEIEQYTVRSIKTDVRSQGEDDARRGGERTAWKKAISKPGSLGSWVNVPLDPVVIEPQRVRVQVKAAGLNFRDVLSALGQLPEGDVTRNMIGSECSGVVVEVGDGVSHVRPGDRVVAFGHHCFASEVIVDACSVNILPASLSFTEGASIPITYLTVDYALNELARLSPGEKILIHSATGGIGLAAVQLARACGAEVFATVGHDFKRDYLRDIGVEYVMDSRSLDFVEEIWDQTQGEGVDVVLNALSGEFIPASMSVLKPFGRFLEIGKRDIYADFKLGLYPFRKNLSYFGVDLGQFSIHRPDQLRDMFDNLMQRFATGKLVPSPIKVFSMDDIAKGFEFMALARHIGKVVFAVEENLEVEDVALDRFRAQFGAGIAVADGLDVFGRLIASDETPACMTASAGSFAQRTALVRHQFFQAQKRSVDTPYVGPRDANEEMLKQIWESTLGLDHIGINDEFEALGGDSINAIMLQASVKDAFEFDLSLASLFNHSTISKLSGLIDDNVRERAK